jgi:hypothetical protein
VIHRPKARLDPETVERLGNRNQAAPGHLEPRPPRVRTASARHSARTSTRPAWDPRTHTPRLNPRSRQPVTMAHASSRTSRRRVSAQSSPGSGRPPGQAPAVSIATDQHDGVPATQTPAEPCRVPGGVSGGVLTTIGDHPERRPQRCSCPQAAPCPQATTVVAVAGSIQKERRVLARDLPETALRVASPALQAIPWQRLPPAQLCGYVRCCTAL